MGTDINACRKGFPGGFTVLMSVYRNDDAHLFKEALTSVFSNTIQPNGLLLVVDGPISWELDSIIQSYSRSFPMEVIRLPVNGGLARALNAGLLHIKTPWVVRADADDFNVCDRFEKLAAAVNENPEVSLVGGNILEFDGSRKFIRTVPYTYYDIRKKFKYRNPFNHMTVAFKLEHVLAVGGYPDVFLREDYALWAVMYKAGFKMLNIPYILVNVISNANLYKRRGGIKYAMNDWRVQKILVDAKLTSWFWSTLIVSVRSLVFIIPNSIRSVIYKKLLRNRHQDCYASSTYSEHFPNSSKASLKELF